MSFALTAKLFEDQVPVKVTGVATAVLGAIVARKDSGITKVEDLKGRKIAAVVGTTTFLDIRTLTLKGYGFDVQKDTQLITAQAPPDMATMIAKKDVDAVIAWQPVSDLIVQRGDGVYLAKQIDLWRKATGRADRLPGPCLLRREPELHREAPDVPEGSQRRPARRREPLERQQGAGGGDRRRDHQAAAGVVEYAHGQTVQMLHGLSDEQIDTLVVQLKLIKESGFLKSDVWDNPERIKKEFFWRGVDLRGGLWKTPPMPPAEGAGQKAGARNGTPTRGRFGRGMAPGHYDGAAGSGCPRSSSWRLCWSSGRRWRVATARTSCRRPRSVAQGLVAVVLAGEVWTHAGASLYRIAVGFGARSSSRCCWASRRFCGGPRGSRWRTWSPSSTPHRSSCGSSSR